MNNLREVPVGGTAKVVKIHGEGAVKRRIMDMGITKGVEVCVRKVSKRYYLEAPYAPTLEENYQRYAALD